MIDNADFSGKLAIDANSLNQLKASARENSPEAIKAAAKQFEAVFMNMVMKSMREATPQDSPFDSEQSRTFTSMLDQQLSNNLSAKGIGLADILVRQLSKTVTPAINPATNAMEQAVGDDQTKNSSTTAPTNNFIPALLKSAGYKSEPHTSQAINANTVSSAIKSGKSNPLTGDSAEFHHRMSLHAEAASRATGMPANLMLGQAALESGWGKREIKSADGSTSHNLFGIKATGNWKGKVVETTTTEYINGVKQKRVEKFRAYDSYAESFKDFANLIQSNPRYKQVVASVNSVADYARAMQKSGYATDPNYATKLASVINKISA